MPEPSDEETAERRSTPEPSGTDDSEEPEEHPRGTLFLMLVYLMVIVALWGYVYLEMLQGAS